MNRNQPILPGSGPGPAVETTFKHNGPSLIRNIHVDPSSGPAVTGAAIITFDGCVPIRISACLGVSNRKGTAVISPLEFVPVKESDS